MNSTKMLGECTFELGSERDVNGDARVAYVIIDCNLLSVVVLASIFLAVLFEFNRPM